MEIRVAKSATHSEVVACAIEALGVQEEEEQEGEGEPRIFRIDGTVVPDSDINGVSWTIARYLSSLHKSYTMYSCTILALSLKRKRSAKGGYVTGKLLCNDVC